MRTTRQQLKRSQGVTWFPVLSVLVAVAFLSLGCEDPQSASCLSAPEGYLWFRFTRAASSTDITGLTEMTAELLSIQPQSTNPPLIRYVLKSGGTTYWLELLDMGFFLPLKAGNTYQMTVDHEVDEFLETFGLLVQDETGVRAILESDWFAENNNPDLNYVFQDGYGDTGLKVRFTDPGCEPRQVNSNDYKEVFNWQLSFSLGNEGRTLYQKKQGTLGPYTVRVLKAQRQFPTRTDLINPQFSWILMPTEDFVRR